MAWCLTKPEQDKFKQALLDGTIDPFKMANMTSAKRRSIFETITSEENAIKVNALYESKLDLKFKEQGFITWAKRAAGLSPEVKRDVFARIDRLREAGTLDPKALENFKEDLARTRLGFAISFEQAQTINEMSKEVADSNKVWAEVINKNPKWATDPWGTRKERRSDVRGMEFGLRKRALENYINSIKEEETSKRLSFKKYPIRAAMNEIRSSPKLLNSLFKSLMATFDNSFWGRQGAKMLFGSKRQKAIWANGLVDSFGHIKSELKASKIDGFTPMDFIMAEIYSRPNSLNGKYRAGGYQLDVVHEEVIPTSLPERIPGFGRVFKAAETAFTGGALKSRADLADMYISKMDSQGLNTLDPKEARGAGHLVGSLTGRGSLGKATPLSEELAFVFWSIRFIKSNFDTLTAHQLDPQATAFSKKEARINLVNIVTQIGGVMMLVNMFNPDLVDEDPRSTNFGKIRIGGKWTDITGGMAALVRLAFRTIVPTRHNGEWGLWQKSSAGKWTNLTAGEYGKDDAFDVLIDGLFANRLAPVTAIIRDRMRGELFGGEPFNIQKAIVNSATPISIQTLSDLEDEKFSTILGVIISEFFGASVSTYKYTAHWAPKDSQELGQFFDKVGEERFKEANVSYNRAYNIWLNEVEKTDEYKKLSESGQSSLQTSARRELKLKIFKEYGFKKKKVKKTSEEKKEAKTIKKLKKTLKGTK